MNKCVFLKNEVEFLGHCVSECGLRPLKKNLDEIVQYKFKDRLFIEDNLLMLLYHQRKLIVAPNVLRKEIITISHNTFTSGHFGIFKTHRKVLSKFWWPTLFEDVKLYFNNCDICLRVKLLGKKRSYVGQRDRPKKPMEVSIDYLTGNEK